MEVLIAGLAGMGCGILSVLVYRRHEAMHKRWEQADREACSVCWDESPD